MARWERAIAGAVLAILSTSFSASAAPSPDAPAPASERMRKIESFDSDWRFFKGDNANGEATSFNDASWRKLDVPHDWSIEGPFDANNPAGGAGAFLPAGVGWYRRHFSVSENESKRRAFIEFDGVMANSDVWINGFHLGKRPYGYVTFRYELTGHLNYGGNGGGNSGENGANVLAVRADNARQPASRWYAGAGIYRHVRLILTDPVHFEPSSTFITTPTVGKTEATVHIHSTIVNESDAAKSVAVETAVLGPSGSSVGATKPKEVNVPAGKTVDVEQELSVPALLWNLDKTNLHQAVSRLKEGGKLIDDDVNSFGIRTAEFRADTGFWLNGENIKLKGVCLHDDLDGLGTAVPLLAWEHRLEAIKRTGCNAIRTSHNPVAPEFLDLCDRMGLLVMDEFFDCWTVAKNPYDYSMFFKDWSLIDARDTIRRDRNHPSIVIYSAGNEIHDTPKHDIALPILKSLVETYHANDPTRPVTQALFRPNTSHDFDDGLADMLDVIGVNYRDKEVIAAHEAKPTRKIIGTENGKDQKGWEYVRDNPAYSGQFLWAGADYLGESRRWPGISRENGLIDLTDGFTPIALQRQSWWSDQPMVAIARDEGQEATGNQAGEPQMRPIQSSDWTPTNDKPHEERVIVYSNAEQVELSLNGKSLGSQDGKGDNARSWRVPFEPGTLSAVARSGGKVVATDELHTAGRATKILLTTTHPKLAPVWDDVAYVTATVVDDNGVREPLAKDLIKFAVEGAGKLAAVENADVNSTESFIESQRHVFRGSCVAVLRATSSSGKIRLSATAAGLDAGSIEIDTVPTFTDAYGVPSNGGATSADGEGAKERKP